MKSYICIFVISVFISANGYSQVADCDVLAGSPLDPQKQTSGVGYDRLNSALAIPVCKNAVAESPQTARLWFQYGRALEKGNKLPDAIIAYQEAAKLNSGAAYNNIGELYRDGKGFQKDLVKAEEYFSKAADLNSPEGKDNLSNLRKATRTTPNLASQNVVLVNYFGPTGWAKCMSGNVAIAALAARGDKINPEILKTNQTLGTILGSMRQHMLANGTSQSTLDTLINSQSLQIRSGDDALRIMSQCVNEMSALSSKIK